ncbi:alpha/beta hydrolase [Wenzhouxiangella sp. XN79A]|uniref:alpha/beta hydrolase-fold protein n=1 Tax=Wenzhouxiangella sp. XN79A TaxID=2724193 RepID=UPI00144A6701|nr:alpha/beta hydrolase [Wenzhouxiangella sp. XN79A]
MQGSAPRRSEASPIRCSGSAITRPSRSDRLDRGFHVLVRLPRSYGEGDRDYPMVFLLDGGILFPMLSPYQLMMEVEGSAGEVVVVGISCGGLGFANGNLRATDSTAPSPEVEYFSGAAAYQEFLADEWLPRLRREFRIDPDRALLFGQSLGGQFAIHAALNRPELFSTWVAINPAIHANLPYFQALDAEPAETPTELVLAMGSEDPSRYRDAAAAWLAARRADPDPGMALQVIERAGAHHATSAPAAYFGIVRRIAPALSEPN